MYDMCDVLRSSYSSADVMNHVLCDYGEGNMGKGIRKLAGEMLYLGGKQSYNIGYKNGCADTYLIAHNSGLVKGSLFTVVTIGAVGAGIWCAKKAMDYYKNKRVEHMALVDKDTKECESNG